MGMGSTGKFLNFWNEEMQKMSVNCFGIITSNSVCIQYAFAKWSYLSINTEKVNQSCTHEFTEQNLQQEYKGK